MRHLFVKRVLYPTADGLDNLDYFLLEELRDDGSPPEPLHLAVLRYGVLCVQSDSSGRDIAAAQIREVTTKKVYMEYMINALASSSVTPSILHEVVSELMEGFKL